MVPRNRKTPSALTLTVNEAATGGPSQDLLKTLSLLSRRWGMKGERAEMEGVSRDLSQPSGFFPESCTTGLGSTQKHGVKLDPSRGKQLKKCFGVLLLCSVDWLFG